MNAPFPRTAPEALARYEGRWGAPQKLGFDLNAAHMKAHGWVDIARPLIKAYLALDLVQSNVLVASHEADPIYAHDVRYGAGRIAETMKHLLADIDGMRDQWIGDLSPPSPNRGVRVPGDQMVWDDYDDLCDMWQERIRDVASVDAAIDREARS